MKQRNSIIIIVVIIIVILAGIGIYTGSLRTFSTSSEWVNKGLVMTSEDYNRQNPDIIQLSDGCWRMYTHGNRKNLGENSIFSFYSCDGFEWQPEGMRIESAAMPAAVILDDNRTRIYYQKGIEVNGEPRQALASAVSDNGLDFTVENESLLATEQGELDNIKAIAHFEIVKLENGYRIYFDEGGMRADEQEKYNDTGWNWPVQRIRSIYSEDGLNWKLEPGVRIDIEQPPLTQMQRPGSCSVIKAGDEYQMYFYAGFSPWEDLKPLERWEWSGTYMATSRDGLDFDIIDERLVLGGDVKVLNINSILTMYVSEGVHMPQGKNDIYRFEKRQ